MSPVIRISDAIFKRLQEHATPLVDTPATVIEKLLDFYDRSDKTIQTTKTPITQNKVIEIDPDYPEDLTHTKIMSATFGKYQVTKWNKLVDIAHIEAMSKLNSFDELKNISISNIINSESHDKGFRFLEEIGISIQGENANQTWKSALHLAKHLRIPIIVKLIWRSNKKSSHPGKTGILKWEPNY